VTDRFKWLLAGLVDHAGWTTLLVLLVSAAAVMGYVDPQLRWLGFDPDGGAEPTEVVDGIGRRRGGPRGSGRGGDGFSLTDGDAILVVESEGIFTPFGAKALRRVVSDLEALPWVSGITWMDRAPPLNLFGLPEPVLPREDASPQRFELARKQALRNPLIVGQLLSPDAELLVLLIRFDWLMVTDDADVTDRLREVAELAVADVRRDWTVSAGEQPPIRFALTGRVPIRLSLARSGEDNQFRYQMLAYAMILGLAIILFRGWVTVLVTALAPALGVFWTLGWLRYLQIHDNPFNDVILPILLSLVGFTDGVHMMVHIRKLRQSGHSSWWAARGAVTEVGLACGLTSLTTAVGFASLAWAQNDVVREFGLCCVVGVGLTFLAVVTVIPLACLSPIGRWLHPGEKKDLIDRHLGRLGGLIDWILRRHGWVSLFGIALTLVLAVIAGTLRPDSRLTSALPQRSEVIQAMHRMDYKLGGLETGTVEVLWPELLEPDSPQIVEAVERIHAILGAESLLGSPISIYNLLLALPGEGPVTERMTTLELLPPPLKRAFIRPSEQRATVIFRVQDLGIAKYGPVFARLEQQLSELAVDFPGFEFRLDGGAVFRWRNLYQVVVDLATSLGTASLVIFLILTVVYGSLRLGLISIIPNLFPLVATASILVFMGQSLELVSVCAFTVCLGIAVDDTIHFLTRYTEERKRGLDEATAIRQAFVGVGTALIMTTMVLVAGFASVLMSDTRDHRIFAVMGGMTIFSALLADMTILPALLYAFRRRGRRGAKLDLAASSDEAESERSTGISGSDR
jgi:predicted RND superfamily exporter protein